MINRLHSGQAIALTLYSGTTRRAEHGEPAGILWHDAPHVYHSVRGNPRRAAAAESGAGTRGFERRYRVNLVRLVARLNSE
jgi:hypothetical protein